MSWIGDKVRAMVKNWLQIQEAQGSTVIIQGALTHAATVFRNRILYHGDPGEIEQFFKQCGDQGSTVNAARFWTAVPSKGLQIRKIHSGLPGAIIDILADIVIADMLDVEIVEPLSEKSVWESITEENDLREIVAQAVQETLVTGDGAFKISFDPELSKFAILEFFSGSDVEYEYTRGRLREIVFKSEYKAGNNTFTLRERYGKGYIRYELTDYNDQPALLGHVPELADLRDIEWTGDYMAAAQLLFYKDKKFTGRGRGIFDRKVDTIDALDECISQWQDALRGGRIKRYIPNSMIPVDPEEGKPISPNPFDNQFFAVRDGRAEGGVVKVETDQPEIDYEGYLTSYISALDRLLQGIISPSTLGIDVKKLDNAEAQREKEKATLYTRNKIISVLTKVLPELVSSAIRAQADFEKRTVDAVKCEVDFGEYANPSFESQIETIGKGATTQIISIETQVEELWGDTKDDKWKSVEVTRIKAEKGIVEMLEPSFVPGGFADDSGGNNGDIPGNGNAPDPLNAPESLTP